jgi:S1-C subfamily serine protease
MPAPRRAPAPARAPQPPEIIARALAAPLAPDRAAIGVTLGEPDARGLRIDDVAEDGPAAKAGLKAGDYITAVGDVSLRLDPSDLDDPVLSTAAERRLRRAMERLDAGDEVTLRVAGQGGERTVRVKTVRADELAGAAMPKMARATVWGADDDRAVLGLSVTSTGTVRDTLGAFVASVVPGGPAERAGIYEGARIMAVNDVDLRLAPADTGDGVIASATASRLERALGRLDAGDEVRLRVYDGGRVREVRVRTAKAADVYDEMPAALRVGPGGSFVFPEAGARGFLRVAPRADQARVRVQQLPRVRMMGFGSRWY